jgi:hypothetical protein
LPFIEVCPAAALALALTAIARLGRPPRRLLFFVHASPASAAVIDPVEKSQYLDATHARRARLAD